MVSMSGPNPTFAPLILPSNISADIWDALLSPLHVSINTMVIMLLSITPDTKITKPSKSVFLPSILSSGSLYTSLKSTLRCYVIMASMQNTINRKGNCVVASLPKSLSFCVPFRIGVIPYFSPLAMTLYVVPTVVLPCRFWKFTTKKLHYLNNIERPWAMDNSMLIIILSL